MKKILLIFLFLSFSTYAKIKKIEHVILLGIDGYGKNNLIKRPYRGIPPAITPNMDFIKENGAWTLDAQIDSLAWSGPNWMGILTGYKSKEHRVLLNRCYRGKGLPTIFEHIKNQMPEAEVGVIYDWDSIGCYPLEESVDFKLETKNERETAQEAVRYIKEKKPTFLFTYFGRVDTEGHAHRGNSKQYNEAVEATDKAIGEILQALKIAEMLDNSLVILTSDHGHLKAINLHSGPKSPVPLFFMGPNVIKGEMNQEMIRNNMVAPLIAYALRIQVNPLWDAKADLLKPYFMRK